MTDTHDAATMPAVAGRRQRARLPLVVWTLGVVAFLMGTGELIVVGLLPELATTFSIREADAGLLITVYAVGMMIGAPVMALATLRLPRRTALVAALVVFAVAQIAMALSPSIAFAVVARFVAALANGTFWAVGAVVATDAAGRGSSARAISVMVSGFTLANVVGAPIGTAIGQVLGWRGPFVLLTVFAVGAAVLVAKQVAADPPGEVDIRSAVRSETAVLKRPALWLLYLATALIPGGLLATFSYIAPLLLDRAHVPSAIVPVALLGYGVGAVVGVLLGGRFGDHRPLVVLVSAVAVQILVLVAMTVWGADGAVVVPLLVVLGGAGVLVNPVLTALVVQIAGSANTLAVALSTSAFNVGIAFGSALGGVALGGALGLIGPPVVGWVLTALALLPLGVLAATARRGSRIGAAEPALGGTAEPGREAR